MREIMPVDMEKKDFVLRDQSKLSTHIGILGLSDVSSKQYKDWLLKRILLHMDEVLDWDLDGGNQACTYREVWFWR